jgi:hypothetical protein
VGAWFGKLEITFRLVETRGSRFGTGVFHREGTPHGFRNVGDTAAVLEIFVKDGASAAKIQAPLCDARCARQTVNASTGELTLA